MKNLISYKNTFDLIILIMTVIGFFAVMQTFILGKHYIIPTAILFLTIILGNLSYYGLQGRRAAKKILFWAFFLFDVHLFFALFFSVKYRTILGSNFEIICIINIIVFSYLLVKYIKKNHLF